MSRIVVLSLCLFVKLNQSFGGKEFCDKSLENNLMTGVMNYYQKYFLLFRGNQVWSAVLVGNRMQFQESKLKKELIGQNTILKFGFVITKRAINCDPIKDTICRAMLNLTMISYDDMSDVNKHYYRILKLSSDGFFKEWNKSDKLPYNWSIIGVSNKSTILGAAFIPQIIPNLISITSDRVISNKLNNGIKDVNNTETNHTQSYSKITGGFEMNGLPYFVINNTITEYNPDSNQMKPIRTAWDFFCGKTGKESNGLIIGLVIGLVIGLLIVIIFGLIIGGIVFWIRKKSQKKNPSKKVSKKSKKYLSKENLESLPSIGVSVEDNNKVGFGQRESESEIYSFRPTGLNVKKK